jgi:hypothetical protein
LGIVVSAGEAEVFLEGEGSCGVAAGRVFGHISGHVGCIVPDGLPGIAGRSFIIQRTSRAARWAEVAAQATADSSGPAALRNDIAILNGRGT